MAKNWLVRSISGLAAKAPRRFSPATNPGFTGGAPPSATPGTYAAVATCGKADGLGPIWHGAVHAARRFRVCVGACALVAMLGCAAPVKGITLGWSSRDGVRRAIILGFGCISYKEQPGVSAVDARAIGFVLDGGFTGGFVRRHVVELDPKAAGNAVVSIRATPLGMTVKSLEVDGGPAVAHTGPQGGKETP